MFSAPKLQLLRLSALCAVLSSVSAFQLLSSPAGHLLSSSASLSSSKPQTLRLGQRARGLGALGLRAQVLPDSKFAEKEIKAEIDPSKLQALIDKAQSGKAGKPKKAIFNAIKKKSGAKTVAVEFARPEGIEGHKGVELSFAARKSKASFFAVETDVDGGEDDFAKFADEQGSAKGDFPGPVPLVWRGEIKGVEQIAKAKLLGASGVCIPSESLAAGSAEELVQACRALDMEPVCEVTDGEQAQAFKELGGQIACVRFTTKQQGAFLTLAAKQLREDLPKDMAAVACVEGRQGGDELGQAVTLLNAEYDGILFTKFILDASQDFAPKYVQYVCRVLTSKKSQNIQVNEIKAGMTYGAEGAPSGWGDDSTHV